MNISRKGTQKLGTIVLSIVAIALLSVIACVPQGGKGPIVVASKIDTEGELLGKMIVFALEQDGFEVEDRTHFGTTDVIRNAIINNEIDIYPEYTGNGAFFYQGAAPNSVWKNSQEAYETVKQLDLETNNLVWLTRASANNTWAIAVRSDLAQSANLVTLSDLGSYVSGGGIFKLAASEEFITRDDVLPAFEATYGFKLRDDQLLSFSGGNTALTEQAAANQTEGVNAAMAYGTDGQLAAFGLTVLTDDQGVQPVYEPAPLVRKEIYDSYPEIEALLAPIFLSLSLEILQSINSSIAVEGRDSREVAQEYLINQGFIEGDQ